MGLLVNEFGMLEVLQVILETDWALASLLSEWGLAILGVDTLYLCMLNNGCLNVVPVCNFEFFN